MSTNNNIEVLSVSAKLTKTFSTELGNIQDTLIINLQEQLNLLKHVRGLEKQINATHVFIDGYVNSQKQEEVNEMSEMFEGHTFPEKLDPVFVDSGIQPDDQEVILNEFEKGNLSETTHDNVFTQPEAEQYPRSVDYPNLEPIEPTEDHGNKGHWNN